MVKDANRQLDEDTHRMMKEALEAMVTGYEASGKSASKERYVDLEGEEAEIEETIDLTTTGLGRRTANRRKPAAGTSTAGRKGAAASTGGRATTTRSAKTGENRSNRTTRRSTGNAGTTGTQESQGG